MRASCSQEQGFRLASISSGQLPAVPLFSPVYPLLASTTIGFAVHKPLVFRIPPVSLQLAILLIAAPIVPP
jgi:hypothetical protein